MKKIKKVNIELSEILLEKIERAILEDGFHSRSEFIRFLIISYNPKENGRTALAETKETTAEDNEYANVDCEYGIPAEIVAKFVEQARKKAQEAEH